MTMILAWTAHAQSCPDFEGRFRCRSRPSYEIQVRTEIVDALPNYIFEGPREGSVRLIADGQNRPISTRAGSGNVRGTCDANRLTVEFDLTDKRGKRIQFKDVMYMERGALVRLRYRGTSAQSFVCGPVFDQPSPPLSPPPAPLPQPTPEAPPQ